MKLVILLLLAGTFGFTVVAQTTNAIAIPKEALVVTADFVKTKATIQVKQLNYETDVKFKQKLTNQIKAKGFMQTQGEIQLSGSEAISFTAGDSILLSPGFEVEGNTEFTAEIIPSGINKTLTSSVKSNASSIQTDKAFTPEENISWTNFELFPNPASENFNLRYKLNKEAIVSITLHTLYGTKVQSFLDSKPQESGQQALVFPLKNIPRGIYIINMRVNGQVINKRIVLR